MIYRHRSKPDGASYFALLQAAKTTKAASTFGGAQRRLLTLSRSSTGRLSRATKRLYSIAINQIA